MLSGIVSLLLVALLISVPIIYSNTAYVEALSSKIPDNYIVVLRDDVQDSKSIVEDLVIKHGIKKEHVYNYALKGFSAKISPQQLDKIKNDPRVAFVEPDFVVHIAQLDSQVLPTNIDRIDVELNDSANIDGIDEAINIDIAIIDTGIDLDHPDLNVVSNTSFVKHTQKSGNDDNGHGTHVAGIAAALDNGFGVVGVAPGARLHAVKVLDNTGSGTISQVVKGIDWVTKNSDTIDVANLSLTCFCHSKALQKSIQKSVSQGVVYVAAAGNNAMEVSNFEPASYDEVITVSAIVDTDGKCGGLDTSSSFGNDDSFALFSNFGSGIDIAAPGVNVLSTSLGGNYSVMSGTSMASPHVAGAVALYMHDKAKDLNNDGKINLDDVTIVKNEVLSFGISQTTICDVSIGDGNGGFTGDVDIFSEPLLYVKNL